MAIQKSSTKTALDLGNFESVVDEKLNSIFQRLTKNQTIIDKSISYALSNPGKRIRPTLVFLVGDFLGIETSRLVSIAGAIELIHTYSLVHDDLPCMDDDDLRRGKPSTHKKFGESTAVLAGNSLLTLAFEILSDKKLKIDNQKKIFLVNYLSKSSGHEGIAGGQFSDLSFEKQKKSAKKIIEMQIKKTGKLFSFCTVAPVIVSGKLKEIKKFEKIGEQIGLLFQIADDLIDYKGTSFAAGKKTQKDKIKGKATLLNLFGYQNTVQYAINLKEEIFDALKKYDKKSQSLKNTINFILKRNK